MPQSIDFRKIYFVDKKYVHKNLDENVHIYNLRRTLPRLIPASIFEHEIILKSTHEDREFLQSYYIKKIVENQPAYILRSLPHKISISDLDKFFDFENLPEIDREYIQKFYRKDEIEKCYILSNSFSELEELTIAKILQTRVLLVTDIERTKISEILEQYPQVDKKDLFYANMHVEPDHSYFFEHKLDHVPGIMLIETARQFFVACAHLYGHVPITGVFFTLNNLKIDFSEYIWLSYPTRIELRNLETTSNKDGYWQNCAGEIVFYQEYKIKAIIRISGIIVKMEILEGITINKQIDSALEFNQLPGLQSEVYLNVVKKNISFLGSIVDVSPKHFMVEFIEDVELPQTDEYSFRLSLDKQYQTYGTCILRRKQKKGKRVVANFYITKIDSTNEKNINQIIMRLCHIREQRCIL